MNKKLCLVLFGLLVVALAAPATSLATSPGERGRGESTPGVLPPRASVFGRSYSEWTAAWWQWNFSIPVSTNPTFDTTGENCHVGQAGPVFFLSGIATGTPVTRACTVPSKPLFFPLINVECSNVEAPPFFGQTNAARRACAQGIADGVGASTLQATIDGVDVKDLTRFRFASPPYRFTMPAQDNILGLSDVTVGRSVSDGYWLMLVPLSPGVHTLHFEAAFTSGIGTGFSQDVTYTLTVVH